MSKILKFLFFFFSFFLSLKFSISNFFFILISAALVIDFIFISRPHKLNFKNIAYSTAPIFILSGISLIWSINLENGMHILGKQSPLLLLPLALLLVKNEHKTGLINFSLKGLVFGVIFSSLFLLINLIIDVFGSVSSVTFSDLFSSTYTSHNFTKHLKSLDPSYLGIYSVLSLAVILFKKIKITKNIKIVFILIIVTSLLFINSRIIFFILLILLLIKLVIIKDIKQKIRLGTFILLSAFVLYFVLKDTYVFKKVYVGTSWELSTNIGTSNTSNDIKSDSRLARWHCAIEKGNKKPIIGYGIGSELNVLLPCYKNKNMLAAFNEKFNTHNQFLSYYVTLGLTGVFILFLLFFTNTIKALKNKNLLAIFFFISLFLMCLVENIFARNAGIIFFAMYGSLFNIQQKVIK